MSNIPQQTLNSNKKHSFKPGIVEYPQFPVYFKYVLFILPLVFGILCLYCYAQSKTFFSTYPDSTYIYLINGTNIASGNLDIGHYDNPGTPVHILGGIIIYITHLFIGKENIVYKDVLANPELYLRYCSAAFGIILLSSVYFSARLVLKHTGNILTALFFQLLPICCFFTIHLFLLVRMGPEDLIIASLIYYYAFLWVLCYKRNTFPDSEISQNPHLMLFAFFSALLVTTKMTCLPFLVLPFFLIPKFLPKCKYVILTIVFAAIMIYPIWPRIPEMYNWFTRLATHSGEYGQGQAGVSMETLGTNFIKLFTYDLFFSAGYVFLSVVLITGLLKNKFRNSYYKLILGFWIICTVQLMLATKQFGYHYLIASEMLIIPGFLASIFLFTNPKSQGRIKIIFFICCLLIFGFKVKQDLDIYSQKNSIYESSIDARKYDNIPKIITTGYQGSCFPESALRFGASYGGPRYHESNYFLRTVYPNAYFFDMQLQESIIKKWDIWLSPEEFFYNKPKVLVYFIHMNQDQEEKELKKMTAGLNPEAETINLLRYNEATTERFYLITVDTTKVKHHFFKKDLAKYDFERTNTDHTLFVSSVGNSTVGDVQALSDKKSFSGNHSLKILSGQYVLCTALDASAGDAVEISANCFSPDKPVGIDLSSKEPGKYTRNSESITYDYGNGWKKVSISVILPQDYAEKQLEICLHYFGLKECYIDDLTISISKASHANEEAIKNDLDGVKKFILRSKAGNFVSLSADSELLANEPDASKAEIFEKEEMGNGIIALKSSRGFFVCDDRSRNSQLIANRKMAQAWESFQLIGESSTSINIKSSAGKYVSADQSKKGKLVADRLIAGDWETFEVIKK